MKKYIGFNLDQDTVEKLKIIGFMKNKNRTQLIEEALQLLIDNNSESFKNFQEYVKKFSK